MAKRLTAYQQVGDFHPDRKDHLWVRKEGYFKCVTCGACCTGTPPPCPTPEGWQALRYEPLTPAERGMAPFKAG